MAGSGFAIGSRRVGEGEPTYVIAEGGVNHRCRLDLALEMVREARQAGADAIKFQTYKAGKIVTRWAERYWEDDEPSGTQYAIFKRSDRFGPDEFRRLAEACVEEGIAFLSTPFDLEAVAMLDGLGMPAFKIASADLTDAPLLERVAATGKPVLQSTGAAMLQEVGAWLARARNLGVRDVGLLHCVLCYPTAVEDANLRRIARIAEWFPEAVVGLSDHTDAAVASEVAVAAVALGAGIVEKHFTLNRDWPGDDHYHSADPAMLARMVEAVRTAERALGAAYDGVLACEERSRQYARRSIIAARLIRTGETVRPEMLIMKRPGTGIPPTEIDRVVGRKAARDIAEDATIEWDDLA